MKPHLPSRLRSALLTALASVSIPTLTAATLVTFSSQAAAEYMPGSFQKTWTSATPASTTVTNSVTLNKENVNVNSISGNVRNREVIFINNSTTPKDYYAEVTGSVTDSRYKASFKGAYGTGLSQTIVGNMYVKHSAGGYINRIDAAEQVTLNGNAYLELAGTADVSEAYGTYNANINGSCTMVIKGGNYGKAVACCGGSTGNTCTVTGGTFVEIDGGTFSSTLSPSGMYGPTLTIKNGTHLLIKGGTFSGYVFAGAAQGSTTIEGGVSACITGGTFNDYIYGGTLTNTSSVSGDIDITITGGKYNVKTLGYTGIYACGDTSVINNSSVSLTISGDYASFANGYIISAGARFGETFSGEVSGKLTLANLTEASSLLNPGTSGIQVKGLTRKDLIAPKDTVLEMSNVIGTLNAALSNFTSMEVKDGSTVTLTQALNESLGGATTVNIAEDSTLALESAEDQTWTLSDTTLDGAGTLGKTGKGTLAVSGTASAFTGSMDITEGTLEVRNGMETASLSGSGKLAKTGEGKMSVEDASDFTGDILATGGTLELEKVGLTDGKVRNVSVFTGATVNLLDMKNGTDSVLTELDFNGGEFGVYKSGEAITGTNDDNVGMLTLAAGDKIVVGAAAGSKLEANLTTLSGSILDFTAGGVLTMGCELDVQDGTTIAISSSDYESLMDGNVITLFTGVDNSFCVDVTDYVTNGISSVSEGGADPTKVYLQTMEGGAVVLSTTANTPEPTTATLSLLALAGLAARRRRSKAVAA